MFHGSSGLPAEGLREVMRHMQSTSSVTVQQVRQGHTVQGKRQLELDKEINAHPNPAWLCSGPSVIARKKR